MEQQKLRKYADLLVQTALNLRPGQPLYIEAALECESFVCLVEQAAFEAGAGDVCVRWVSNSLERGRLFHRDCDLRTTAADCARVACLIEQQAAYLRLESPAPDAWEGISPDRLQARLRTEQPMRAAFRQDTRLQNVIACAATPQWARAVFPGVSEEQAVDQLWQALLSCTMADQPDPAVSWAKQVEQTEVRKRYLNKKQYTALRLTSETVDLTLGLPKDQVWEGGGMTTPDGRFFMPNLPSYEVFTSPVASQAEGWVQATLPLNYQGQLIEGIRLTFREGKVVEYSARTGESLLREILTYDDNSCRLGEVALVEQSTPVARQGIVFYTTVCDENASCHLALGSGFAMKGEDDAKARGINRSKIHVDFMFGSDDLQIVGLTKDGQWETIFQNGHWAAGI